MSTKRKYLIAKETRITTYGPERLKFSKRAMKNARK
jgi:hypothetical protein